MKKKIRIYTDKEMEEFKKLDKPTKEVKEAMKKIKQLPEKIERYKKEEYTEIEEVVLLCVELKHTINQIIDYLKEREGGDDS